LAVFNRPTDIPIDQVKALKVRGFDNNQIVQALQRNGYSSTQIFDALNQSELVNPGQPTQYGMNPTASTPQYQQNAPAPQEEEEVSDKQIEEMVETIVEEKWQAASKDQAKMQEWKSEMESKIAKMEQRMDELQSSFDKLQQAVVGKVGEYDKNILAVGAELKAMEKVFSKVLPVFTENVNELNRITQTLSDKKK
jgi:hypothetical protein